MHRCYMRLSLCGINPKSEARNPKQIRITKIEMTKTKTPNPGASFGHWGIRNWGPALGVGSPKDNFEFV
jgi:hypothetical protein